MVSHWNPDKVVPVKVKYVSRMAFMVQACCVSIRRRVLVGGCHDISTRYLRCCTGVSQLCRIRNASVPSIKAYDVIVNTLSCGRYVALNRSSCNAVYGCLVFCSIHGRGRGLGRDRGRNHSRGVMGVVVVVVRAVSYG